MRNTVAEDRILGWLTLDRLTEGIDVQKPDEGMDPMQEILAKLDAITRAAQHMTNEEKADNLDRLVELSAAMKEQPDA